jgi:hypothetical protein
MSRQCYPEAFKIVAVKVVTEKGKPVADVAQRLGMSVHSLTAGLSSIASLRSSVSNPPMRVFYWLMMTDRRARSERLTTEPFMKCA